MKKLFLIGIILGLFVSCSSSEVNEIKIKASDKVAAGVKTVLDQEFSKADYAGMDCEAETGKMVEKVRSRVDDILKVDRAVKKGAIGMVGQFACGIVLKEVIPMVINSEVDGYPCSKKFVSIGLDSAAEKVCSKIPL